MQFALRRLLAPAAFAFMLVIVAVSCAEQHVAPAAFTTTQPLGSPTDLPGVSNFAQVSVDLYRGGQPTADGFERLKQMGIRSVVDLRGKTHRDDIEQSGLHYFHIPSSTSHLDEQEIVQFLRLARDQAFRPMFVHDERGADRVGLYVAAYRMVEQGWTARDAEAELPRFHFNPFWKQIPGFLNRLNPGLLRRQVEESPATQSGTKSP